MKVQELFEDLNATVTVTPQGDDAFVVGYQYVVRVDGRAIMNGLTRSSAMHEKQKQVIAIAKKEKLGDYA